MLPNHSTSFSINNPINLNMRRMTGTSQTMDRKTNTLRPNLIYYNLTAGTTNPRGTRKLDNPTSKSGIRFPGTRIIHFMESRI